MNDKRVILGSPAPHADGGVEVLFGASEDFTEQGKRARLLNSEAKRGIGAAAIGLFHSRHMRREKS